ncbi:hypothetical protein Rhopal_007587-T1 [Rhodotorula paludigena]|uniref:Cation/H+ exchanger transmembrane domain-containing protein n=1 Tax=Rhodotorula paludigena TaxID=86838 RepID=A0AAV5GPK0_9BASI|nr:hypothetical protein Rhopal_007587-T1 [Rhodotorula paludigena]
MSAFSSGETTGTALAHFLLAKAGELYKRSDFEPARGDPSNSSLYAGLGEFEEASHEMFVVVPEVNIVHLALVILSVFITFFGLFSGFVKERLYVGEAIIATCFGIAFSAYGAGIFAPRTWSEGHHTDEITLELTRIVIALSVFAVGVELPRMLGGWFIAAALMYALIPALEFLPALVLAAGVTPTDPILASSVVGKGKYAQEHVPSHIRHILQAESGCNDGAAFPFLYLALFLLLRGEHSVGEAVGYWILLCLLYQIILGTIIGVIVGIVARKLLKFSKRRELIDRESMVAMYVALALLSNGLTTLAGSDDLLAAFAFTESIEESNFSSTIDLLANCAIFIYIGATMPFNSWNSETTTLVWWRMLLLCLGILVLRRLPAIYALYHWIPDIKTTREAIFAGHFGPMGVGAIFISTLAAARLPTPSIPAENNIDVLAIVIVPVTYAIVLCSILVHGLTISFFTLGRRVHSRVQSFSRTLTAQSSRSGFGRTFSFSTSRAAGEKDGRAAADEPSWMSRVKRATRAEDIVINRDDESPESLAEKGIASGSGSGSGSGSSSGAEPDEKRALEEDEPDRAAVEAHAADELRREGGGRTPTPSEIEAEVEREIEQDQGKTAMFGAPPSEDKVGAGRKEQIVRERKEERLGSRSRSRDEGESEDDAPPGDRDADVRADRAREMDDHPPRNILGDLGECASDTDEAKERYAAKKKAQEKGKARGRGSRTPSPMGKRDSRLEARYCRGTRTWQQGRKIVVDHGDGEVDVIDVDASPEAARKAASHPQREVVEVPESAVEAQKRALTKQHGPGEHEASAVKRAAAKMMKQGEVLLKGKDEANLAPEERERRRREKYDRDAWCRKERHYRESEPQGHDYEEWVEGDKIVTERGDGKVTVRDMTPEEKRRKAKKHLDALRGLGHPIDALEAEYARIGKTLSREGDAPKHKTDSAVQTPGSSPRFTESPPPRSDSPELLQPPARTPGVSLFRSERIDPPSDEDEPAPPPRQSPSPSRAPPVRPVPTRQGSTAMQAMRDMLFRGKGPGRSPHASVPSSREPSPERDGQAGPSIRFATVDRPTREGSTGTGRALPVVGSSLSVRKVPSKRPGEM